MQGGWQALDRETRADYAAPFFSRSVVGADSPTFVGNAVDYKGHAPINISVCLNQASRLELQIFVDRGEREFLRLGDNGLDAVLM